jgi:hypothetical protein
LKDFLERYGICIFRYGYLGWSFLRAIDVCIGVLVVKDECSQFFLYNGMYFIGCVATNANLEQEQMPSDNSCGGTDDKLWMTQFC